MGDLISRETAIIEMLLTPPGYYHTREIVEVLKNIPPVDAVPVVHGRWIKEADRDNRWHCNECKFVVGLEHRFYNYCFNCGAKMDGERMDNDGEDACG